ncbi:MAG: site-2 protease family protein [Parcubacteria group bacterium]
MREIKAERPPVRQLARMSSPRKYSIAAFNLFGVAIRVDVTWLFIAVLFAWSLATGAFPELYGGLPQTTYWWMALVAVVGLGLSVVLHEIAHTLVGRRFGVPIGAIRLFAFGGVAELEEEPNSPRAEFWMAVAGPVFSLLLAALFWLAAMIVEPWGEGATRVLAYLALLNVALAVFNMLPAVPLDGGRVLRSVLWGHTGQIDTATIRAAHYGQFFGGLLMALGGVAMFTGWLAQGLWWVLIGWFLRMLAGGERSRAEARQFLRGTPVRDLTSGEAQPVPSDMTVRRFIDERLLHGRHELYPVERDGRLVGLVTPRHLLMVSPEQWNTTTLGDICSPRGEIGIVQAEEDSVSALETMRAHGHDHAVVEDRGRIVGILSLKDLLELTRLRAQFQQMSAAR